jgi:DNA adenine methylase
LTKMLKPPIGWLGGKSLLRKRIIEEFPDHSCYVEVFGGAGWVLFGKSSIKSEILNDLNKDLMNFWNVVKFAKEELIRDLQFDLVSRDTFRNYHSRLNSSEKLGNVERAKLFFYLLKTSFGGQMKSFGTSTTSKPKLNLKDLDNILAAARERLMHVTIENLDFKEVIRRYDRPYVLFYLDPPYRVKTSKAYSHLLNDQDYIDLRDILLEISGKFVLSINDDPFIRELFSCFRIKEVVTRYSLAKTNSKKMTELLIMNY